MSGEIIGIKVLVKCAYCDGKRRIPGGKYQHQYGEVIDCPCCGGSGHETEYRTWKEFIAAINGALAKPMTLEEVKAALDVGAKARQAAERTLKRSPRR